MGFVISHDEICKDWGIIQIFPAPRWDDELEMNTTPVQRTLIWRMGLVVLGLALGASVVGWSLALWPAPERESTPIQVPAQAPAVESVVKSLAGGNEAGAAVSADAVVEPVGGTWKLQGVVAAAEGQGLALLSKDEGPARNWRVGQTLPDGLSLLRVSPTGVELGDAKTGEVKQRLSLPKPPTP
jgi:hypothetical protein